ncbi:hypothetical protein swp_3604 [Shewanella piezotolerans WP3]|uniref:Uncharacterized protein n=1 Tax=Shewanella piezotolerans (strain WP3 / JCM 13877) TaxID=225849 RepID=B8CQG5_SHEPW|nr:hypothetical protein swp_3604 [Shewanella piezotolerans WP3]
MKTAEVFSYLGFFMPKIKHKVTVSRAGVLNYTNQYKKLIYS